MKDIYGVTRYRFLIINCRPLLSVFSFKGYPKGYFGGVSLPVLSGVSEAADEMYSPIPHDHYSLYRHCLACVGNSGRDTLVSNHDNLPCNSHSYKESRLSN